MTKKITTFFKQKSLLFTLVGLFLFSNFSKSQVNINIGTGTAGNTGTTYPCALQDYYEGSRMQYLYLASELNAAGMTAGNIDKLTYNVTQLNGAGLIENLNISIGHTTATSLQTAGWDVFTGAVSSVPQADYTPVVGANTFTFSSPFFWNGTDNILIEICNGSASATGGVTYTNNPTIPFTSGLSFNGSHTFRIDNQNGPLCGTTSTTNTGLQTDRPNLTFSWAKALPCTGAPVVGTVIANPTVGCLGTPIALSSAGGTLASELFYQWEDSVATSTGFTPRIGDTVKSVSVLQLQTTWYRLKVTCKTTGDVTISNVVMVTTPPTPNGIYTIDKANPTTFPTGRNFKTFNDAYNAMKCGISAACVFNVVPGSGPYVEQLIVNGKIPNSSPTNTITFNGNGNFIQFTSTNTNERAVIKLKGAKYFIFDSLQVDASVGTYGIGFHLINDADSNIIRNCNIISSATNTTQGSTAGVAISGADNNAQGLGNTLCDFNQILNNTIAGGYYGVTQTADFAGGANGGNIISFNIIKDFYKYGIYTNGSYNSVMEANKISRPTRTNVGAFDGIYFTGKSNSAHVFRNRIFSPFKAVPTNAQTANGINLDNAGATSTFDYLIDNNLIYDFVHTGAQTGINNNGSANVQLSHNTISLDDGTSTATSTTRGYNQTGAAAVSVAIINNLITVGRGGTGTKHCIYLASGSVAPVFADNNDYYINAPAGSNFIGFFNSNRLTLQDWQTAMLPSNNDQNALSIQPVYFLPVTIPMDTANFSPTNAAMDDKAFPLGMTYDINGPINPRNDIGCYEFIPPPCVPGSLNGVTEIRVLNRLILGDTTVCEGTDVKLGVNVVGPFGSSQTFQWERVKNLIDPPQDFGGPKLLPDTTFSTDDTSYYYRCKISCLGVDFYTNWRLLGSISSMPAGDYYINSNYPFPPLMDSDYVSGVAGAHFKNYRSAVNAMRYCGIKGVGNVVFRVDPSSGPYVEQVKIDTVSGANFDRQVVFKGNNTTLQFPVGAPTVGTERAVVKITRADFINLDSINIDASSAATFGYGVQLVNNADSNSVKNCTINLNDNSPSANFAGIVVNATDAGVVATGNTLCDGNLFESNTIKGGYYGITLVGVAANLIENNKVSKNKILDFYNTGIYLAGTRNTLIDSNTFARPTRATVGVGYGVNITSAVTLSSTISNNRFTNFYGGQPAGSGGTYGVYFNAVDATAGNENFVYNNAFYNLNGTGVVYPLYNNGSDNVFYYHNSIAIDNPTVAATGGAAGFYQTTTATGLQFKNNIIHITRGGPAVKHCINLSTAATATSFESNNNVLYVDAGVTNGYIGNLSGNRLSLTDWQNSRTPMLDSLSFNYDPLYTDVANGNLKPQFYLIDNKGVNVGVATDIESNPRPLPPGTKPDIGAWEFTAPTCPTPLLAGTASVNPSSGICLEAPIRLDLTGNSPVGQIYFQWQDSIAGGNWQNLGPIKYSTIYDTISSVRNYYRCIVTCAATGASVVSTVTSVTLNTIMPAGTYTIDSSMATNYTGIPGQNFNTFNEAVSAMQCGILGSVVFDVKKGTYNEQVRIPYVAGTSPSKTITFQGNNGVAADKILTWANADAINNYVLRFDSCTYVTFKNITINNTNPTYGRVVDFVVRASNDNLLNCVINTLPVFGTATTQSAVFSSPTKGTNLVIKGNTINGGANGIYFAGTSGNATSVVATTGHLIDSNIISGNFGAGIFVQFNTKLTVSRNTIDFNGPAANGTAGIYANYCDTAFNLVNNKVNINNTTLAVNGIQLQNCRSTTAVVSNVNGNEVYANSGNAGTINGIYITSSSVVDVKNNVVVVNSAATTGAYGITNFNNAGAINYYHNSVSVGVASTTSAAAQLTQSTTVPISVQNNIFSNKGGGRAIYMNNAGNFTSDYNMLHTSGTNLVVAGTTNYTGIFNWQKASGRDKWSINYPPAFISSTDLHPDLNNSDVWAMHGRAIQIKGNVTDINGNYRPDSLTAGVPDLGAYEFFPIAQPTAMAAIPATPSANTEQVFYFGSDTAMRIRWGNSPPPSVQVKRFSGVVPPNLNPKSSQDSMFFYTQVEIPGGGSYFGDVKTYYIAPWLGSIPENCSEYQLGLAKTTPGNKWGVGYASRNNIPKKMVYENNVTYFDKFSGLCNPYAPPPPPCSDTSNSGKEFWLAYPANQLAGGETYQLYLSTNNEAAYVTVSIPCLGWVRTYNIPPNTVQVSDILPQAARHQASGKYCDGINITSDVAIVAYAHCWGSTSSGATMLMPTCTWGYDYKMLGFHQDWGGFSFSSYFVVAKEDNTKIAIANTTTPSGVPVTTDIVLNKGEWYQVLAASSTADLSGSSATSIPNDQGKCLPFAFFSGDTRTLNSKPCGGGGDFAISQNFPGSAWGKKYLTAPTSRSTSAGAYQANLFRIALKDANQNIYVNGTQIYPTMTTTPVGGFTGRNVSTTLIPGTNIPAYVEFLLDSASYLTSDRPMLVCQFMSGACSGVGDPDMAFISPLEQGINKISFYTNTVETISANVLTLVGSSNDIPSICEVTTGPCNPTTWTKIAPHPYFPGKSVYIKHWPTSAKRQVTVEGDSTFTAITYGLGSVESYMYNAGTNIINLNIGGGIKNDTTGLDPVPDLYNCSKTPFKITTRFPLLPDSITWKISGIPGIHPNQDVTIKKPYVSYPVVTVKPNGDSVYTFTLPGVYITDNPGYFTLVTKWWHPDIEGCDKKREDQQFIQVVASPKVGFTYSPNPICPNTMVNFVADSLDEITGIKVKNWAFTSNPYGINTGVQTSNSTAYFYANSGTDTVNVRVKMEDKCIGDSALVLTINPYPVVSVLNDSIHLCASATANINIQAPLAGATYTVYPTATGGTAITSGDGLTPFSFPNMTSDSAFYIECVSATGCVSVDRKKVKITVTQFPIATATPASITACIGTSATFNVAAPVANAIYTWFDAATLGNTLATGNSLTINPVTADASYYLETSLNGCVSIVRFPVTLTAATTPSLAVVSNAVTVCSGDAATFSIASPDATVTYNWYTALTGGTATTGTSYTINPATSSASYFVSATSVNGCTTSPRLQVDLTVTQRPVVSVVAPNDVTICKGTTQVFTVQNPVAGATYSWYNGASGGTALATGTSFTTPPVNAVATYYVDGTTSNGCTSISRATVKVSPLDLLAKPIFVTVDSTKTNEITFGWTAVTGAVSYAISIDGGAYVAPNGIPTPLSHTLQNLNPGERHKATVMAIGVNVCQNSISDTAYGKTVANKTYYPNSFTPNGDGKNDNLVICGSSIKELKYAVYNQYGEKIWETTSATSNGIGCYTLWDGTQRGVPQPSGVYIFASRIVFLDGKVEEQKGSINLIR